MQKKQRIPVLYTAICFLVAGIISAAVEPAFIQTGRYKFRPPQKIMDAAGIKPGMVVGEVGAGEGFFTFSLAERVGENGIVYANDIAPEMLDRISYRCQMQGVKNIKTVLGKVEDPLFPIKNLDMIIMANVFHDLEKPLGFLEIAKKYLKPEALLVIVDRDNSKYYKKEIWKYDPHYMTREQLLKEVEKSSFKLDRIETFLLRDNIYIFRIDKESNVWQKWLTNFRSSIKEVKKNEDDVSISNASKIIAWERIFNDFRDNDPNTEEDEELREYINERILYWSDKQKISHVSQGLFRSSYKTINSFNGVSLLFQKVGFSKNPSNPKDFKNKYKAKTIKGDTIVIDEASGLMWYQGGSSRFMSYFDAKEWIIEQNSKGFAGYYDWRLPTAEEVISLLESSKKSNGMYIDPIFSQQQSWFWTGDKFNSNRAFVLRLPGALLVDSLLINFSYVRPVRSL
jgi:ubiquinone/menaquinone biosynthesis C-methylase UbiE